MDRVISDSSLMLVLPIRVYTINGTAHVEKQAHNGLRLWLDHFSTISLCLVADNTTPPPVETLPIDQLHGSSRLTIVRLPAAFTPLSFFRQLPKITRVLRGEIDRASHLQFAIGGLWGDWASVACFVAHRRKRRFAVWTDRVESEVTKFSVQSRSRMRSPYWRITAWLMHYYERAAIRRATIGLFHGMDCFSAFSPISANPHLVHNIHVGPEARIDAATLAAKQARTNEVPLKIVYAGRAHPEKGVSEWIETLAALDREGVYFSARWFGDGPALAAARDDVARRDLSTKIEFPGNLEDRDSILSTLRDADLFLFCHKTPESPRCLIEALISGTPIVGFSSAYPQDLSSGNHGGVLTAHDPAMLARAVMALDRPVLSKLMAAAALDGYALVDEAVFAHRAQLIKDDARIIAALLH